MKISILSVFPQLLKGMEDEPLIDRALKRELVRIEVLDIKDFAGGSFRHIDDSVFGGGPGMLLRCRPVLEAMESVKTEESFSIAFTPSGERYNQAMAHELAGKKHLILICGHYEGFDERILSHVDREISIGDYILTGGELPARLVVDSLVRLLDGVIRPGSLKEESFENGLLEYPQYTQPADYRGECVPEVLLTGNHEKIRRWRLKEALRRTYLRRPDLLENRELTDEEGELLRELKEEKQS